MEAIWQTPTKELTEVKGMSEAKIQKLKEAGERPHLVASTGSSKGLQATQILQGHPLWWATAIAAATLALALSG